MKKIPVTYFHRYPVEDYVSIEHIYSIVRAELAHSIDAKVHVSKYPGKGILKRIHSIIEAGFKQAEVNHITGEIHYLIFLMRSSKTILSIHHFLIPNRNPIARLIVWIILWYLPLKKAKYVTAVSPSLKKSIVELYHCDPEKIWVIPNPVNPVFMPVAKKFSNPPELLQPGTKKIKNVERLLRALEGIDCSLHIVGTLQKNQIELLRKYKIKYRNSPKLTAAQMQQAYTDADIVTFVSTSEGFGIPIIEANRVGRAVITGNVTSMPEVAGNAALLVDPLDVNAIRNGILKLINDEAFRNQLINNGFENAKRYKPDVIAGQYLDLYKTVYENTSG